MSQQITVDSTLYYYISLSASNLTTNDDKVFIKTDVANIADDLTYMINNALPSAKLVIKGKDGNVEFKAVETAEFPRVAFSEGSYYPLVEDDGSEGATLKVRVGNKVYRLKPNTTDWEVFFDFEFSNSGVYVGMLAAVDNNFNITAFNRTNNRAEFTAKLFKRPSTGRPIYSNKDGFFLGPVYADYNYAGVPYAERSANANIGNVGNKYAEIAFAEEEDFSSLPVDEIGFFWLHKLSQSMQSCIFRNDKTLAYWGSYSVNGTTGALANLLCITAENVSSNWAGVIRNRVLFNGKVRVVRFPVEGSSPADPSFTDYDTSVPLEIAIADPFMVFALKDKNIEVPFEATFVDPYLANATMQGSIFDMNEAISSPVKVSNQAKTQFSGSYADVVASHDSNFNSVVTAKKDCIIVAMNYSGDNYTAKVVEHVCNAGDTFNADMASPYSRSYPWVYLMYQNSNELPVEICFRRHQSSANVFGYFYNTQTKQADLRSGIYLSQSDVVTSKILDFDGDLLIQPMSGVVQILDGGDSWSENYFSGFAMVFLASNSTIIVNTTAGDDVMIFDKNGTLLDEQTAGNSGNVTFTVPTTKLGRQYHIQSVTTGASADIVASGNMSVRMVMPEGALQIYKDGQFSNVIDGFNISNYKLILDGSSEYTYANAIPYLNTSWGINNKAGNNSGDFTIDGNYIIKSQQSTSAVSGTYYIPIKRVSGCNKLRCSVKMRNTGSSNAIEIGAYLSKPSDTSFPFEIVGRYQNLSYTDQNDVELCAIFDTIKDVDYIRLMGDIGTPAYNDIKLIKDYVYKSETPVNVIFKDGQWGPGVTTDFDFTGKAFSMTSGTDINTYAKHLMFSKYLLRLNGEHQTNAYVINGNSIYHEDDGLWGDNYNLSNIYIPIKRAYGYTKCKVKMGQLSMGTGGQWKNYVACVLSYINSNRVMTTIRDLTIFNTISVNEYEIDISNVGYCDYIVLGCTEGDCVWQSITLE